MSAVAGEGAEPLRFDAGLDRHAAEVPADATDEAELPSTELPPVDPDRRLPPDAGLRAQARFFFGMKMNRLMYATFGIVLLARLVLWRWSWADLVVAVVLVALYPFVEWSIHVLILHWKPKTIFGRTIDLGAAQNHRAHHRDPENPNKNLADSGRNIAVYIGGWAVPAAALALLVRQVGVFGTVLVYAMGIICYYEWFHFLIHSGHRSTNGVFQRMRRHHFRHHYRNESYWFGVATTFADTVLRTNPTPASVPQSATARELLPVE